MKQHPVETFKVQLGASVQITTAFWLCGLISGMFFAYKMLPHQHGRPIMGLILGYIIWCFLRSVRAYRIRGHTIEVVRWLGTTRINAKELRKMRLDSNAMNGTMPLLGNPGLFGFYGWFQSDRHGLCRVFVSDRANVIRVKLNNKNYTYMFSPAHPELFLKILRENTRPEGKAPGPGSKPIV